MREKQFVRGWYIGMGLIAAIVGVVAGLVLTITATAQAILANAKRALGVTEQIVANTDAIWKLQQTNEVAGQLLQEVQALEQHATKIADELGAPPAPIVSSN
jgi:hypothetical protein